MEYAIIEAFTALWLVSWALGGLWRLLAGPRLEPALLASVFYHQTFVEAFTGTIDLTTDTIRMMLLTGTTTTPDNPDHQFVSDIDADEDTDGSYARVTLTTPAVVDDDANDRAEWDFDDVVFSTLSGSTVVMAVAEKRVGADDTTPTDDPLIALWDIADTAPDGSDFTLQVGTEGAVQFS